MCSLIYQPTLASHPRRGSRAPGLSVVCLLVLVCVGTQCVPGVATCVVAKIYRPIFFIIRCTLVRSFLPPKSAVLTDRAPGTRERHRESSRCGTGSTAGCHPRTRGPRVAVARPLHVRLMVLVNPLLHKAVGRRRARHLCSRARHGPKNHWMVHRGRTQA